MPRPKRHVWYSVWAAPAGTSVWAVERISRPRTKAGALRAARRAQARGMIRVKIVRSVLQGKYGKRAGAFDPSELAQR